MTNLQDWNVFGEVLASESAIIVNATSVTLNDEVRNEVEVLDSTLKIPANESVRYIFVSRMDNQGRSKTFRRQVSGPNIDSVEPIDRAISVILKCMA
ncbi:MAG: hypothetical protein GYA15_12865 [Leptolinea sp.]|jgi:hypothetical protein|nr:hypothetical protein [Leptolinea sp.]